MRSFTSAILLSVFTACGCAHQAPIGALGPTPVAAKTAPYGVPAHPIRVVAYNVHWDLSGVDRIAGAIKPLHPDVLFLEEVMERDLPAIADALEMKSNGASQFFYSPRPPEGTSGTAILSRFPLTGGQILASTGDNREHPEWGHGAWADANIDGRRIALACVHLTPTQGITPGHLAAREKTRGAEIASTVQHWRDVGSPPLILGGDFNQLASGPNYETLASTFQDALGSLGKTDWTCSFGLLHTRIDYLWLSSHWHPTDGNVVVTDASDHRPIWADVSPK